LLLTFILCSVFVTESFFGGSLSFFFVYLASFYSLLVFLWVFDFIFLFGLCLDSEINLNQSTFLHIIINNDLLTQDSTSFSVFY
jgi:hypothetical protein